MDASSPASLPLIAAVRLTDPDTPAEAGVPLALVETLLEPSLAIALPTLPPLGTDDVAHDAFDLAREAESGAEVAELERLQGVYRGQVQGRLARVLEMALEAPLPAGAPCRVEVIQNERGEVMDIDLAACEIDEGGRRRLESALRRASPLPAPPAGLALASTVTLDLSRR